MRPYIEIAVSEIAAGRLTFSQFAAGSTALEWQDMASQAFVVLNALVRAAGAARSCFLGSRVTEALSECWVVFEVRDVAPGHLAMLNALHQKWMALHPTGRAGGGGLPDCPERVCFEEGRHRNLGGQTVYARGALVWIPQSARFALLMSDVPWIRPETAVPLGVCARDAEVLARMTACASVTGEASGAIEVVGCG